MACAAAFRRAAVLAVAAIGPLTAGFAAVGPNYERPQMPRVAPHSRDPGGPGAATAADGV